MKKSNSILVKIVLTITLISTTSTNAFAMEKATILDGICDEHGTKAVILTKTGSKAHAPYNENGEENGNWSSYVSRGSIRAEFCSIKDSGYDAGPGSDSGYYCNKKYQNGGQDDNLTNDWKNHWAALEIQQAMDNGWVNTSDKFRPNDAITRAEFVKIVNKAFGYTTKGNVKYSDVKTSDWFYGEVAIAVQAGYIDTKASNFRPNDNITRQEVASIITSIMKSKDTNLDKLNKYKDANQVSEWAKSSVEGSIEQGYMGKGSDMFRPKDNITRAESIVTLSRIVK